MRTIACVCLHYGVEYLEYAIRSVIDYVDEVAIFYADLPSHGHYTEDDIPKAESKKAIFSIVDLLEKEYGSFNPWHINGGKNLTSQGKLSLFLGSWSQESEHRNAMEKYAKESGYDVMFVLDSDEVWQPETIKKVITSAEALKASHLMPAHSWRLPMAHLWQGFNLICRDPCMPERVAFPQVPVENGWVPMPSDMAPIYHFGYAISDELMAYKWKIHGHKAELRPGWMEEKWLARATQDVHPTNLNFWNAEPFDKSLLPDIMRRHPRFK